MAFRNVSILILLLLLFLNNTCSITDSRQSVFSQNSLLFPDIYSRRIVLPSTLIQLNTVTTKQSDYKLVTSVNTDCNSCIETFLTWQSSERLNSLVKYDIIFIAIGSRSALIDDFVKDNSLLKFRILLDSSGEYLAKNNLYGYHKKSIVLDAENRIIYVGDPISDDKAFLDLQIISE